MNNPILELLTDAVRAGRVSLEKFTYTAVWNTLLASASGQIATVTIDPGADFIIEQMNLSAFSAAGTIVANPDYLMEVTEKTGRGSWSDNPVHVANWTGQNRNSSQPGAWDRYVIGNNTITFKLTNNTATAARVDLGLLGQRVTYNNGFSREQLFSGRR